jgi:hypothetical protein
MKFPDKLLAYSAIDLLYAPDGRYIFLELNAVGQFGWLEGRTGIPLYATLDQFGSLCIKPQQEMTK